MPSILGIDPGLSGGIAVLDAETGQAVVWKMPQTEHDIIELVWHRGGFVAYMEKITSTPPQNGRQGSFTFGRNVGQLQMALAAANIPVTEVAAGVWQRSMGCLSGGNKNVTKRRAQQLFPGMLITNATADALLIGAYGWRCEHGTPWPTIDRHTHIGANV